MDKNEHNIVLYNKLVDEYGDDVKSLNWGSRESQFLRFQILSEISDLEGKKILDFGCGLGDMYDWMSTRYNSFEYVGFDITPNMIDLCKDKYPGIRFEVKDLLRASIDENFDYVLASGVFTYQSEQFLKKTLISLFEHCTLGVAFNVLSNWGSELEEEEYYADPLKLLQFCKSLTPFVVLRHDYHQRDFTIYLNKNKFNQ